jgi:hypothetical protein
VLVCSLRPSDINYLLDTAYPKRLKRREPVEGIIRNQKPLQPHPVGSYRHNCQGLREPRYHSVRPELAGRVPVAVPCLYGDDRSGLAPLLDQLRWDVEERGDRLRCKQSPAISISSAFRTSPAAIRACTSTVISSASECVRTSPRFH